MKDLSAEQKQQLEQKRSRFEAFLAERVDVLIDFFERLGVVQPEKVISDPDAYLETLDRFLNAQDVNSFDSEDVSYLRARLIYFIGELFVQRYSGHWFVHENPDSPQFSRYVVGGFPNRNPNLTVDPAAVAQAYLEGSKGGGLSEHLQAVEHEMFELDTTS